jgi:hypothetical protein
VRALLDPGLLKKHALSLPYSAHPLCAPPHAPRDASSLGKQPATALTAEKKADSSSPAKAPSASAGIARDGSGSGVAAEEGPVLPLDGVAEFVRGLSEPHKPFDVLVADARAVRAGGVGAALKENRLFVPCDQLLQGPPPKTVAATSAPVPALALTTAGRSAALPLPQGLGSGSGSAQPKLSGRQRLDHAGHGACVWLQLAGEQCARVQEVPCGAPRAPACRPHPRFPARV